MSDVTDEMVEAVVAAEAPYFRRLNDALRRQGFQVAAYVSEHLRHVLKDEIRSGCPECVAYLSPSSSPSSGQDGA